ncbi:MAG: phosphotransferase family protein, partial [Micrococcales bacterium]|nr:phosphotransferase family protein [Micrococcales bacterium]
AVLDWEMATLGDPLTDVALLAAYQGVSLLAGGDVVSDVARAPGYPSVEDLLSRYAHGSGRDLSSLAFHLGLAHFKLAVILEGIHYRYEHGQTIGEGFAAIGDVIGPLVRAGLQALEED